jgi:hypothetical protein
MSTRLTATLILGCLAFSAAASDKCDVPKEQWRSTDELKAELESQGWSISNIKTEDGCYEVYAKDSEGKRIEAFVDPATFEIVGYDN